MERMSGKIESFGNKQESWYRNGEVKKK